MKKLTVIILLLSVLAFYAQGQDTLKIRQNGVEKEDEKLQQIDIRELPEIIKVKLASSDYTSWILQAAYKAPGKVEGQVDYVVELKKDNDVVRVRFDDSGNRKKDTDRDQNRR